MKHTFTLLAACFALCACDEDISMYRCSVCNDTEDTLYVHAASWRKKTDYAIPPQESRILFQNYNAYSHESSSALYNIYLDTIAFYADAAKDSCLLLETSYWDNDASKVFFNYHSPQWKTTLEMQTAGNGNIIYYLTETFHFTTDTPKQ